MVLFSFKFLPTTLVASALLQSLGATPELLWRFPTTNSVYDLPRTSPAVGADGTIYFSSSSNLFAIRPDGTLKWAISQGLVAFSPVVGADGTVYAYFGAGVPNFTGITNTLHALTPAGQIRWQRTEFNDYSIRPQQVALGRDGTIYSGRGPNRGVVARSPDGESRWGFALDRPIGCGRATFIAIASDGSLCFGEDTSSACSYQQFANVSASGALNCQFTINLDCAQAAISPDGTVYVGAKYGFNGFFAFGSNGTPKWRFQSTNDFTSFDSSPVLDAQGDIFVGATDGNFYALSTNGVIRWQFAAGAPIRSAAALSLGGNVLLAAGTNVFCLDSQGSQLWQYGLTSSVQTAGLILSADGILYVGTDAGLVALRVSEMPAYASWPMAGHDLRGASRATGFTGGPPVFDYLAPTDAGSEIVMFGELNRPYRIFESSDLQNWSLMTTLSSANGTIFLDDPNVATQRFYRSVSP